MRLTKWIVLGLLGLPIAEIVAVMLVAAAVGWLVVLALLLATSLAGVAVLRLAGRADIAQLRATMAARGAAATAAGAGRPHLVLAGILLLIPGFITDLLSGILLVGPLRRRLVGALARAIRNREPDTGAPQVIDLAPDEWHQVRDRRPEKPAKKIVKSGRAPLEFTVLVRS